MLHFVDKGSGEPLVLLHAFPLSHRMWRPQFDQWSSWSRVIAMDLPGFGESPRQSKPSVPQMAKDVAETLDHLGVNGPVVMAGLSMGGYVAFEFLRQFPERLRALGLFATRAAPDTPEQAQVRRMTIGSVKNGGLDEYAKVFLSKCISDHTRQTQPETVKVIQALIREANPEAVVNAMQAMIDRRDSRDLLPEMPCPALVVGGEQDALIPAVEAEHMAQRMPMGACAVIPDAGHLLNLEQPEALDAVWKEFLETTCGWQFDSKMK